MNILPIIFLSVVLRERERERERERDVIQFDNDLYPVISLVKMTLGYIISQVPILSNHYLKSR